MLNVRAAKTLTLWCAASLILTAGPGCAGRKVRNDFEARQAHNEPLVRETQVEPITEGPYHLALHLGAPAIEAMVREAVAPRLAEMDPASMSAEMGGDAAKFAEAIEMSRLSLGEVEVTFPGDTDGILRARVRLEGRLGVKVKKLVELAQDRLPTDKKQRDQLLELLLEAQGGSSGILGKIRKGGGGPLLDRLQQAAMTDEPRWMNIAPEVTVRVFMGAQVVSGRPSLVMEMREVESFALNIDTPFQFPMVEQIVQETGRSRISAQLTDPKVNPGVRKVIPLPEQAGKGDLPIRLLGIGLNVVPGSEGEIFLGITTNLNVQPGLTAKTAGPPMGEHGWALTLSEGTLGLMVRTMAKAGKIPLRFDRKKNPDPEGPIVVEPETFSFSDGSFVMGTRIWNLKFPAFWRHFDIYGKFLVEDGQLKPEIAKIEGTDEGEGNLWLAGMVEKKQIGASETSANSPGARGKPSLPLPMSDGKRVLQLNITDAVTTPGALTLRGSVEIKDAP